jgi:hypothetical protein
MNKLFQHGKTQEREERKEQGFFDGRFRPKVIPDGRKKNEKKLSRSKQFNFEDSWMRG